MNEVRKKSRGQGTSPRGTYTKSQSLERERERKRKEGEEANKTRTHSGRNTFVRKKGIRIMHFFSFTSLSKQAQTKHAV
jgi:hypothetical protein